MYVLVMNIHLTLLFAYTGGQVVKHFQDGPQIKVRILPVGMNTRLEGEKNFTLWSKTEIRILALP